MADNDDLFTSVHWNQQPDEETKGIDTLDAAAGPSRAEVPPPPLQRQLSVLEPRPEGFIQVDVTEPLKELDNTKDAYISYAIVGSTSLPMFSSKNFAVRRRFTDFVFLHDHLAKEFLACVVPPIPGKHRMGPSGGLDGLTHAEYVTGDRFSQEFVEKRRTDLKRFLQRLARHPTLARSTLFQAFLESTEWNVRMHQHLAHPPVPDAPNSLIDSLSDSLVNAFAKVKKPDERFVEMRHGLDGFDEALTGVDRIETRVRTRVADLSADYDDFAASVQGLSYLESGITEPLNQFETALLDVAEALRLMSANSVDPFLYHLHSLQQYSGAFRGVLKLRDQKQLDFEELSTYLSTVTTERDRLSTGHAPSGQGIGSYLKSKVDSLRGADTILGRQERLSKLDKRIKELQDAVVAAQDTSDQFNDEVIRELEVFQLAKKLEMKDLLTTLADGHIAMYKKTIAAFEAAEPSIAKIRTS